MAYVPLRQPNIAVNTQKHQKQRFRAFADLRLSISKSIV
jgi:hypothetical protein